MKKRSIKAYTERRNEILAVAGKLFFRNGYDATSVEAIIREAEISKGAFYHYFSSKDELLDTLALERAQAAFTVIDEQVFANDLNAIDRMILYFSLSKSWKLENRELLMAISRVLLSPQNIMMRERFFDKQRAIAKPTLTRIVRQGVEEKLFTSPYPDDIADILFSLFGTASVDILSLSLEVYDHPENISVMLHKMEVLQNVFERILGTPEGSIVFTDRNYLTKFFCGTNATPDSNEGIRSVTIE